MIGTATLNKLYNIITSEARIANRVSKKTDNHKRKKEMYQIKKDKILEAVEMILKTKTQAVKYTLGFDEEKNLNTITFKFKKEKYMKETVVSFHITDDIYIEIKRLQETL